MQRKVERFIHRIDKLFITEIFARAVLMSGSMFSPYPLNADASEDFVRLLTCDSVDENIMLKCLQEKSLEELQKAYESIVRNRENRFFGPNVDSFIDDIDARMFLNVPFKLITENNYTIDVPILMGITSNEGAFVDGKKMTVKSLISCVKVNSKLEISDCRHVDELRKTRIQKV